MDDESFFTYELPRERIAQYPAGRSGRRDSARLLVADGELPITDRFVSELPDLLRAGDVLVVNDSRVLPSRFFFEHRGSSMEVLLLARFAVTGSGEEWEALARPMRRAKEGETLALSRSLEATVLGRTEQGDSLRLLLRSQSGDVSQVIVAEGSMPIPGYIRDGRAEIDDRELYQTVFAEPAGSVAAPTAGLHLTHELLSKIRDRGVETVKITLHVGAASFLPVRENEPRVLSERYTISSSAWQTIARARKEGRRVVAVGTTTARALESFALRDDRAVGEMLETALFIRPGFSFQVVDLLMTNFHQPETTHLLLVSAFVGGRRVEEIYSHALAGEYRFLSYGDSMLLTPRRP